LENNSGDGAGCWGGDNKMKRIGKKKEEEEEEMMMMMMMIGSQY
jgi:hypothetical protein